MDKIEICNIALGRIGVANIERIDEASEAARLCNRYYDFTRSNVLERFPWTFAARREQLALLDVTPTPDFKYAYRYPQDALCIQKMFNQHFVGYPWQNQYKIAGDKEGRVIYTNIENAWIEYTANVSDASQFDAQFIEALSWKLAAEIAYALTGNTQLMQMCVQAYNAYFAEAKSKDADEENIHDAVLDRLADARFSEV